MRAPVRQTEEQRSARVAVASRAPQTSRAPETGRLWGSGSRINQRRTQVTTASYYGISAVAGGCNSKQGQTSAFPGSGARQSSGFRPWSEFWRIQLRPGTVV